VEAIKAVVDTFHVDILLADRSIMYKLVVQAKPGTPASQKDFRICPGSRLEFLRRALQEKTGRTPARSARVDVRAAGHVMGPVMTDDPWHTSSLF